METMSEKKKRYRVLKTLFGLAFVLLCGVAFGQGHYVVAAHRLNVRKSASSKSAIMGVLSKGDEVYVHSFKGSWAEIDFKNGSAFVSKNYIEASADTETETISSNMNEEEPKLLENYEAESKVSDKKDNQTAVRYSGALNFAYGGKNQSGSYATSSSTFTFDYESGEFFSTTPVFYNLGLGLYFSKAKSSGHGYSYKASNWGLRIPFHVGYMFGEENNLHIALRGGVYTNFLFGSKMNDKRVKVSFKDRFGWTGSAKATVGYGILCLTAEYLMPFKSGADGVWMFGLSLGM